MRSSFAVLLLVLYVASVVCECPANCAEHGRCSGDTCICNTNYEGTDCSIFNKAVTSGQPSTGTVERSKWQYYNIYSRSVADLKFNLSRTGTGDCDLYIQRDTFPDKMNFIARNLSTAAELVINLNGQRAGTYYAGVYGYAGCSYTFTATIVGSCPDNCNGHGQCMQGTCRCYSGYAGEACEIEQTVAVPGQNYASSVAQYEWKYYTYTPRELLNGINWVLQQTGSNTRDDCDIYVKEGSQPTLWNWDLHNISVATTTVINQTVVSEGKTYYFGVYGYFGCSYIFHLETVVPESPKDCPNNCSLHNTNCFHGSCVCSPGYSGQECETRDNEVVLGTNMSGYAGENAWNYYHIHARSSNSLVVSVATVDDGDCDIYINENALPTRFQFQYVDISTRKNVQLTIADAGDAMWYIGLYGWRACTYVMNITETNRCECAAYPNGHGSCAPHSSTCICDAGWVGDACDKQVIELQSKEKRYGDSVTKNSWNYYVMHASQSSEFALTLQEKNTTGYAWIFVSHSEYPTLSVYDYSDKDSHKAVHEISYFTKNPQTGDLYIGVYGSPYMPESNSGKEYEVVYNIAGYLSDF